MKSPRERRAIAALARPAGDRGLAGLELVPALDQRLRAVRKEEVDARAEADQADPLAADELVPDARIEDDPAREGPGDLLEGDASGGRDQCDAVLLVFRGRLVREGGVLSSPDV